MSQAKVDRYKQEKANRKSNMKKQKMLSRVRVTVAALVAVALVGWCGYSVYSRLEANKPAKETVIDYGVMNELDSALSETAE